MWSKRSHHQEQRATPQPVALPRPVGATELRTSGYFPKCNCVISTLSKFAACLPMQNPVNFEGGFWSLVDSIPKITRYYLGLVLALTLGTTFGFFNRFHLFFNFHLIWEKFQIWRLLTPFLYFGELSINFLFHLYFIFNYSSQLEKEVFRGKPSEYILMLLFCGIIIMVAAPWVPLLFLGISLTFAMVYVWARAPENRHRVVMVLVVRFPAPYLPWALMLFTLLMGGSIANDLVGVLAGHTYVFLRWILPTPAVGGPDLLKWPASVANWIDGLFGMAGPAVWGFGGRVAAPAQDQHPAPGRFNFWGQGHQLGEQNPPHEQ